MSQSRTISRRLIKICGITRVADIDAVAASQANAIGLNFVPTSPRRIDVAAAGVLSVHARQLDLQIVAVVRDPDGGELADLLDRVDVDGVQLHGNEPPSILKFCEGHAVIKAISWSGHPHEQVLAKAWSEVYRSSSNDGPGFQAFLVDAYAPAEGGGTGRKAKWELLWPRPKLLDGIPLVLAGGLNSDNVEAAIQQTQCHGVDTASGVEDSPGIKSAASIRRFAERAWKALDKVGVVPPK